VIATLGGDPIDVLFRMLQTTKGRCRRSIPSQRADMRYALQQPFVCGSMNRSEVEGLARRPHPRYYGTFPRVLGVRATKSSRWKAIAR
jgi:hypothetical protein